MCCDQYGNEILQEQTGDTVVKKHRPKRILTIVLCVALAVSVALNIISLFGIGKANKIEGKGFSSPEKAALAYLEAMRKGDVDKMISTFAIESYVEAFDFEDYLQKSPFFNASPSGMFLPEGGAYRESLNDHTRYMQVFSDVYYGYFTLIDFDTSVSTKLALGGNLEKEIRDLKKSLEGKDFDKELSKMKIGDISTDEDLGAEETLEYALKMYSSYLDVEDFCDVGIEIEFDGTDFCFYMMTVKIDGRGYNMTTFSPSGNFAAVKKELEIIKVKNFNKEK